MCPITSRAPFTRHFPFIPFHSVPRAQVLVTDPVTLKVISSTCKMPDVTDEGVSCECSLIGQQALVTANHPLARCKQWVVGELGNWRN